MATTPNTDIHQGDRFTVTDDRKLRSGGSHHMVYVVEITSSEPAACTYAAVEVLEDVNPPATGACRPATLKGTALLTAVARHIEQGEWVRI